MKEYNCEINVNRQNINNKTTNNTVVSFKKEKKMKQDIELKPNDTQKENGMMVKSTPVNLRAGARLGEKRV